MFDGCRRDQDAAVEIGEHPLGAGLGTIDSHDAEVLRCGLLDPGMQGAGRFGNRGETKRTAAAAAERSSHTNTSGWKRESSQTRRLVRMAGREEFSLRKQITIPGDGTKGGRAPRRLGGSPSLVTV